MAVAENVAFTQMAMQGQSITAAAGDVGAFDCLEDGTSNATRRRRRRPGLPASGDGRGRDVVRGIRPGHRPQPQLPRRVRRPSGTTSTAATAPNKVWAACARTGAGGGGVSVFWPRPSFQKGPGVQPLRNREVPDVSADADEFTPVCGVLHRHTRDQQLLRPQRGRMVRRGRDEPVVAVVGGGHR